MLHTVVLEILENFNTLPNVTLSHVTRRVTKVPGHDKASTASSPAAAEKEPIVQPC